MNQILIQKDTCMMREEKTLLVVVDWMCRVVCKWMGAKYANEGGFVV